MGYGGIDFNPQPSYGADPFSPVVEGLQTGMGLGLGLQRMQAQKMQMEQAQQQQEEQKKIMAFEKRNKDFTEGLGLMKDKKVLEYFPTEIKNEILRKKIAPYMMQDLGIEMDPNLSFKDVEPMLEQGIGILESKAPVEMKKQAFAKLMLRANPEEQKQLEGASKMAFGDEMTPYQKGILDLRKNQANAKATGAQAKEGAVRTAAVNQADRIISKVDQALGKVSGWSAGFGAKLASVPSTDAKDLAADLQTIKANLGFAELQAMRQASPTGGALGQVAVQELEALQSTLSNLSQDQSPKQLKAHLDEVKLHYQNWKNAVQGAGIEEEKDPNDLSSLSDEELKAIIGGQ